MNIHKKHKGSLSEHIACIWLLKQGYEVFRNISQAGIADILAFKDDEIIKIDVKTAMVNQKSGTVYCSGPSEDQKKQGVRLLMVAITPNGEEVIGWQENLKTSRSELAKEQRFCEVCETPFTPTVHHQKYCSQNCLYLKTYERTKARSGKK